MNTYISNHIAMMKNTHWFLFWYWDWCRYDIRNHLWLCSWLNWEKLLR